MVKSSYLGSYFTIMSDNKKLVKNFVSCTLYILLSSQLNSSVCVCVWGGGGGGEDLLFQALLPFHKTEPDDQEKAHDDTGKNLCQQCHITEGKLLYVIVRSQPDLHHCTCTQFFCQVS